MAQNVELSREVLIAQYRLVFKKYPELKTLAEGYWDQTKTLKPGPTSIEIEDQILTNTVIQMVDVLTSSFLFTEAISKVKGDLLEKAINESLMMIDIVQDI